MAHVIRRDIFNVQDKEGITIVPLGDIHIGAAACDEDLLRQAVERIAADPTCYWIGMGDMIDAINRHDKRFDPKALAPWITMGDLLNLGQAEAEHFLALIRPIVPKCLCLLTGNHEASLTKWYEFDVHSMIVEGVRREAKFPPADDYPLSLGYSGWLRIKLHRYGEEKAGEYSQILDLHLHHGHTGGRLDGAKALANQRDNWTHDADIVLRGHSHNTLVQVNAVERLNRYGAIEIRKKVAANTGTFLRSLVEGSTTYSEAAGYLPTPTGWIEITVRPFRKNAFERINVVTNS